MKRGLWINVHGEVSEMTEAKMQYTLNQCSWKGIRMRHKMLEYAASRCFPSAPRFALALHMVRVRIVTAHILVPGVVEFLDS